MKKLRFCMLRSGCMLLLLCNLLQACDDVSWKKEIEQIKEELQHQKELLTELQNRATIVGIQEREGCHVIEFSDGQTITIKDGHTPILAIGEEGNWYIDGKDTGLDAVPEDGMTPTIEVGPNGNWFINGQDIGVRALAQDGETPTIEIGAENHWIVNGEDTGITAYGKDGFTPSISIGSNGHWVINGEDTGVQSQGQDGQNAPHITNIVDSPYKMDFSFSDGEVVSVDKTIQTPHIRNAALPFMPDTLRILGIGNSYTSNGMLHLPQIAANNGLDNVYFATLEYGGASLWMHWDFYQKNQAVYGFRMSNPKIGDWGDWNTETISLRQALKYAKWDVIVLQQYSAESGLYHTYQPYLNQMLDEIALMSGNARVVFAWQMTWAYGSKSNHPGFAYYEGNQALMSDKIEEATKYMNRETGVDIIIPTGAIIRDLRSSKYNNPPYDLTTDGVHLDLGLGCYAASAAWFETLVAPVFRTSVIGNPDVIENPDSVTTVIPVTPENREEIQRMVKVQCRKWNVGA